MEVLVEFILKEKIGGIVHIAAYQSVRELSWACNQNPPRSGHWEFVFKEAEGFSVTPYTYLLIVGMACLLASSLIHLWDLRRKMKSQNFRVGSNTKND